MKTFTIANGRFGCQQFGGPYSRMNAATVYGDDSAWDARTGEIGMGRMYGMGADYSPGLGADYSVGSSLALPELTSVSNILRYDMEKTFREVNAMPEPLNMKKAAIYALAAVAVVVLAKALLARRSA